MSMQRATAGAPSFVFDPAAEMMPRADLNALQLSRLKATLERAYAKVPHYAKKFDAANVTPADLKSLADIARFLEVHPSTVSKIVATCGARP